MRMRHHYYLIAADLAQFEVNRQDGLYRKGKTECIYEMITDEMSADSREYASIIIGSFQCAKLP